MSPSPTTIYFIKISSAVLYLFFVHFRNFFVFLLQKNISNLSTSHILPSISELRQSNNTANNLENNQRRKRHGPLMALDGLASILRRHQLLFPLLRRFSNLNKPHNHSCSLRLLPKTRKFSRSDWR